MRNNGRKSIIASVIALSLILMGVGYAYWTDTLNITTKATTGELDVTFVDLGLYAQYGDEKTGGWSIVDGIENGFVGDSFFERGTSNYNTIAKNGSINQYYDRADGYNSISFDAELVDNSTLKKQVGPYTTSTKSSDKIELTINNFYPGYAQAFRSDIVNQGTIAAKLSNIAFNIDSLNNSSLNDETKNMLGIALLVDVDNTNDRVFQLCKEFANGDNFFTVGEVDFLRLSALENLSSEEIAAVINNAELLCNANGERRMDVFIAVAMDSDAEGIYTSGNTAIAGYQDNADKDAKSQNDGAQISIDFAWDQFNAGKNEGNGNILVEQNQ